MPPTNKPPSATRTILMMLLGYVVVEIILHFTTPPLPHHPWPIPWRHFIAFAIIAAIMWFVLYRADNYLGRFKMNPQQKTYNDRLWAMRIHLHGAVTELRLARVELDLPNVQRAVSQTERALEIVDRRIKRLHRELAVSEKNKSQPPPSPPPRNPDLEGRTGAGAYRSTVLPRG